MRRAVDDFENFLDVVVSEIHGALAGIAFDRLEIEARVEIPFSHDRLLIAPTSTLKLVS